MADDTTETEVEQAAEATETTPAATAAPDYENMPDEVVDSWLKKRNMGALTSEQLAAIREEERQRAIAEFESSRKPNEDDDEDFATKGNLKNVSEEAVAKAEERMTKRYAALDSVKAKLDGYKDLTAEARQEIFATIQTLPTDQINAVIKHGGIDVEAKAKLYDLVEKGVVKPKGTVLPDAAPTGGEPKATGFRATLTEEQRAIIEKNEELYGLKYTDEMVKESFGL